ncbi:MAG TPA: hypothetical protein VGC32_17760 [Solirubrobacterales bacterium]
MSRRRDPHRHDHRIDTRDLEITRALVEEVLLTAVALDDVMGALLDEIPEGAFPGEENARVLLEMVIGSVHPAARAAGPRDCQTATALVVAIRERILADLHAAAELSREREQ